MRPPGRPKGALIVAREAVFDRIPVSHTISLFEMDRQFADVVDCDDIVRYLESLSRKS